MPFDYEMVTRMGREGGGGLVKKYISLKHGPTNTYLYLNCTIISLLNHNYQDSEVLLISLAPGWINPQILVLAILHIHRFPIINNNETQSVLANILLYFVRIGQLM